MNIPKPPKLFFSRPMTAPAPVPGVSETQMSPPPMTEPTPTTLSSDQSLPPVENPIPENERVWSPGTNPIPEPEPTAALPPIATAPTAKSEPTAEQPQPTTAPRRHLTPIFSRQSYPRQPMKMTVGFHAPITGKAHRHPPGPRHLKPSHSPHQ